MTKRIFRSIIAVAMTVFISGLAVAASFFYQYLNQAQSAQLKDELSLVSAAVETVGTDYFEQFDSSSMRCTLIAADGTVLFDTQANSEEMENHLDREEIQEALATGSGSSSRYSSTLTEKTVYQAVRLSDGTVLRMSVSRLTVGALLLEMLPPIVAILLIAIVVSMILSGKMAKRITDPLNALDLEHPYDNDCYEELAPVLTKISKQHKQIVSQMNTLRQKSDEFQQIIASMSEGLVLLDKNGTVLSMNPSAMRIFSAPESKIGCDFLTVDRNTQMSQAVRDALSGQHRQFRARKNGKEYQFSVNPIESGGTILGAVLLGFDITDKAFAERNRQEFTANVSHELKTPLQSIIGSAELLENGLVKPEDTARFTGNIKKEATRLVHLINDIIRLSQLDEDSKPASETVELTEVAKEAIEVLTPSAVRKNVTLSLETEPCTICGVRRYVYEIFYNLCDNAIRYNVDGGKVTVTVRPENQRARITVADTGIGIAPEHHERIFERFYRVDKSHSKETGGTGLGLSIVKHAVQYHGGSLELESEVGKGTTVTVLL